MRIGATEGFGTVVLAPQLALFAQQHPKLVIDLLAMPRLVHLSRREADIVISLERPARGPVVVTKLTRLRAAPLRIEALSGEARADPTRATTCAATPSSATSTTCCSARSCSTSTSCTSPTRSRCAAPASWRSTRPRWRARGIAVLPAFIAERDKSLRRVLPDEANFTRTFWMSVPAETRHLARMKAVWDFLRETVEAQRALLLPD